MEQIRKSRQVCSLVEHNIALALAASCDEVLNALQVLEVLPAPSVARLLVVVAPLEEVPTERILGALDAARSHLRAEIASELNRKRTPELSFTVGFCSASYSAPPSEPPPPPPEDDPDPGGGGASGKARFPGPQSKSPNKPSRPRNLKRVLKLQKKLLERRQSRIHSKDPVMSQHKTTEEHGAVPIKHWTGGVPVEDAAMNQLKNIAKLPVVGPWVAAMPDVHLGIGATVGSVIPTSKAIIPAAVGVDIGCGMMALQTTLVSRQLPDNLHQIRTAIERAVPHGRGKHAGRRDRGAWEQLPNRVARTWKTLEGEFERIADNHAAVRKANHAFHLGTLGSGNHFIELCLDEVDRLWIMLHSGSRGVGNRIGTHFIELAKRDMQRHKVHLPDKDLAYFEEGSEHFGDYVQAVGWAQDYARLNRELMMEAVLVELRKSPSLPSFQTAKSAVNCHHNYVTKEVHFGQSLYVTRKGAVRAGDGELGIIPGSMGARSFIVRGKGNAESFCSCSHGAGRRMSRSEAKRRFTVEDHIRMTKGVECRKDRAVLDETPAAYKDIDAVMSAQADLVSVEHTLKQIVCIKG